MASTLRCINRYVTVSGTICVQAKHVKGNTHTHTPDLSFYPHLQMAPGEAHKHIDWLPSENADRLNNTKGALPDGDV